MFKTDFSRINELFYRDLTENQNCPNLKGFIANSLGTYYERYHRRGVFKHIKRFIYPDDTKENKLSLDITSPGVNPDLIRIGIYSQTANLPFLLDNLRGKLTADFSTLNLGHLDTSLREEAKKTRTNNLANAGLLLLYFSSNTEGKELIKRAVLGKKTGILKKDITFFNLEQTVVDDSFIDLLSKASTIEVENSSYEHGDSNKKLIHESSLITQPEKGRYFWDYRIGIASNEGILAYILPAVETLFNGVGKNFSTRAFQRMKIEDLSAEKFAGAQNE